MFSVSCGQLSKHIPTHYLYTKGVHVACMLEIVSVFTSVRPKYCETMLFTARKTTLLCCTASSQRLHPNTHADNCITCRPIARQFQSFAMVAAPVNKAPVFFAFRRFAPVFTFTLYARPVKRHSSTNGLSLRTTNRRSKTDTTATVQCTRSAAEKTENYHMTCGMSVPFAYVRNPLTRNFSNRSFFLMPGSNNLESLSISACFLFLCMFCSQRPYTCLVFASISEIRSHTQRLCLCQGYIGVQSSSLANISVFVMVVYAHMPTQNCFVCSFKVQMYCSLVRFE